MTSLHGDFTIFNLTHGLPCCGWVIYDVNTRVLNPVFDTIEEIESHMTGVVW
jgi:hypothetical protein